jgi:hypothetical protein
MMKIRDLRKAEYVIYAARVVAQVFSQRLLTEEARVHSQGSSCGIFDGETGTGTGFSSKPSVFFCQYHSTDAPYSFIKLIIWEHRQWVALAVPH